MMTYESYKAAKRAIVQEFSPYHATAQSALRKARNDAKSGYDTSNAEVCLSDLTRLGLIARTLTICPSEFGLPKVSNPSLLRLKLLCSLWKRCGTQFD